MIDQNEKNLITKLDKLYSEGIKERDEYSKRWDDAIGWMKGNFWPDRRPKYKISAVMNFIEQIVERKTSILTDSKPTIYVANRREGLEDVARVLQETIDAILTERSWNDKLVEFCYYEQLFGMAYTHTCWNPSLDYGDGDVDIVVLDPRSVVFDPFVRRAYSLNDGEYFVMETLRPTEQLRDAYPNRADDIKDDYGSDQANDNFIVKMRNKVLGRTGDSKKSSVIKRSLVRDYWLVHRAKDELGARMYPSWRHIIQAGGCIVSDQPNHYWDGNLPYDAVAWNFNVDSAYGRNELDKLEMPQVLFNKTLATIIENAILNGNNIWIGDYDALTPDDWNKLNNEPGAHVRLNPDVNYEETEAPTLPNYITEVLSILTGGLEKLSGITDVTEGRRPGQVTSGAALDTLASMAQTTIRLKARQLEGLLESVGQKLVSRIIEFYTDDRILFMSGNNEEARAYSFVRDTIIQGLDAAQIKPSDAFKNLIFKVKPGSSLATVKWQKAMMSTQLFQMGIIDREALLEDIDYPRREEIMKRTLNAQAAGTEPEQTNAPMKLPKSILRGGNQETGLQRPQIVS